MNCSWCGFDLKHIQVKHLVCPCKKTFYCDKSCQEQHWKEHGLVCDYKRVMQLKRNIEPTFESQYSQDRVKNIPSSGKVSALSLKKRSNVHFAGNAGQSGTRDDVQVGPSARSSQAGPAGSVPQAGPAVSVPQAGPDVRVPQAGPPDSVPQGSHSTFQAPRDIKGKYTSHGENQVNLSINLSNF